MAQQKEAKAVNQLRKEARELIDGEQAEDNDDIQLQSTIRMKKHHHHHHRPRQHTFVHKYSDEIANGDSADDKDNQKEHDMSDPIVDYNG